MLELDVGKFYVYKKEWVCFVQKNLGNHYKAYVVNINEVHSFSHEFHGSYGQEYFELINNDRILEHTQESIDRLRTKLNMK